MWDGTVINHLNQKICPVVREAISALRTELILGKDGKICTVRFKTQRERLFKYGVMYLPVDSIKWKMYNLAENE